MNILIEMNTLRHQQNSSSLRRFLLPFISSSPAISGTTDTIESTEQRQSQQTHNQRCSRLNNSRRNYCSTSSFFTAIFTSLCVFAIHLPAVTGLACYETVNVREMGKINFWKLNRLFRKLNI